MLIKRKQRRVQPRMSAEVGSSSKSVEHMSVFRNMEGGEVLHSNWAVCSDEIVSCVVGGERERSYEQYVKTLLNMFSKNSIRVQVSIVKQRLHN